MQNTYTAPNGKSFTATLTQNTLTMYVAREPQIERIKVPPAYRSRLGRAIRRPCFETFAAVVDEIE